jgi:hypothetical protein
MSASRGHRSLHVDPEQVVALAGRCDEAVEAMALEWVEAGADLGAACDRLGDSTSVASVAAAYAGSLAAADEAVGALVHALGGGVAALLDAARDVTNADEAVAMEIGRSAGAGVSRGWGRPGGPGGGG